MPQRIFLLELFTISTQRISHSSILELKSALTQKFIVLKINAPTPPPPAFRLVGWEINV